MLLDPIDKSLAALIAIIFFAQGVKLNEDVDRKTLDIEQHLDVVVNLLVVRLLLLVLITKTLVEHVSHALGIFEILVGKHVGKRDYHLSMVANDPTKVALALISKHLNYRGKQQTEECIYHRHIRQLCGVSAEETASLVVEVLTSVGDVG